MWAFKMSIGTIYPPKHAKRKGTSKTINKKTNYTAQITLYLRTCSGCQVHQLLEEHPAGLRGMEMSAQLRLAVRRRHAGAATAPGSTLRDCCCGYARQTAGLTQVGLVVLPAVHAAPAAAGWPRRRPASSTMVSHAGADPR
jgi:hypothetical protein